MKRLLLPLLAVLLPTAHEAGFWSTGGSAEKELDEEKKLVDAAKTLADAAKQQKKDIPVEYGVDVSYPMHHKKVSDNYAHLPHNLDPSVPTPKRYKDMVVQPLGNRQQAYDDFMKSCGKAFGKNGAARCLSTDQDRVQMTMRQPQSMQNYTAVGFKKIKAPPELFQMIKGFWETNKDKQATEQWGKANTYTNNWDVPSSMVSVEDSGLRGGGYKFKQKIWDAARDILSEWTGQDLTQCSLYGIRVYKEGSILAPHVDRLPLVSSAIINVAQDVDEPWPLEVYGHDGKATNVTMLPGDMVLYESHSVIHGRPFPLKGRYMANIFIHFEPTGHSARHNAKVEVELDQDVNEKYREAQRKKISGHEGDQHGLPSYIVEGSPEEDNWRLSHPAGAPRKRASTFTTGSTPAHEAAKEGNVVDLESAIAQKKAVVHAKDENGWTPLHEGARGGHLEVVKLLVKNGADVNVKTGGGKGGTALWWAKQVHDEDHPVIQFLEEMGAVEAGPEL